MRIFRFGPILLAGLLAGCITVDQKITLREDGSGLAELSYSITEQAISQIKAMLKLQKQMAMAAGEAGAADMDEKPHYLLDPNEGRLRSELKKYESLGITVERLSVDNDKERRRIWIQAAFKDLAEVAKADFFPEYGFSLSRNSAGNYVLYRAARKGGDEMPVGAMDPATVHMLTPLLSGFRVAVSVILPRAILETTAARPSQFEAEWVFDFDRDPNALMALQSTDMKIVFDGEGVKLPRIRHERSDKVLADEQAETPAPKSDG